MQYHKIRVGLIAGVTATALMAVACGDVADLVPQAQDVAQPAPDPVQPPAADAVGRPVTTEVSGKPEVPTVVLERSTPDVTATTTTVPSLPGEPFDDPYGPAAGEAIGVVAVSFDDVLNVRAGPGADQPITATLDPLAGTVATGRHRLLSPFAIWWEVEAGAMTGWAHSGYLSRLGEPVSISGVDTDLTADTLLELGRIVADRYVSPNPGEVEATITVTMAPRGEHDLGEVVFDLTSFGDDSVSGFRLHVYGRPTDDRNAFSLVGADITTMCWRGVYEGVCV